jgi:lipopolysaccharide biosynthesis glycosyltransferase
MQEACNPKLFFYAQSDSYPSYSRNLDCQFHLDLIDEGARGDIENKYDLHTDYFQSTLMIYNTKLLEENTVEKLFELAEKYPYAVRMDQGILNLYWLCQRNLWKQLPIQDDTGFLYNFHELRQTTRKDYLILKYFRE